MSKMSSFVLGGLLGAGVALLVAPRSGAETRAMVGEMANGLASGIQDLTATEAGAAVQQAWDAAAAAGEEAYAKGRAYVTEAYTKVADVASGAYTKVADVASNVVSAAASSRAVESAPFAANDDELRAKMEAARKRIAEQIAKNAEEAKAKMESIYPAEAQNPVPEAPKAE